jgi:hypothetical protein
MPVTLMLAYTCHATIVVPVDLARKLRKNASKKCGEPWTYYVKYNQLRYWDGAGVEHRIEGSVPDSDYKRPDEEEWEGEEPSSDESEDCESDCEFCGEEDVDGHECIPERRERDK